MNMTHAPNQPDRPVAAVVLAAGKGTRMEGQRPKVAYEVNGRAMVQWVVDALRAAGVQRVLLVVGYGADEVRSIFHGDDAIEYVVQAEQLGTGHAVLCCREALDEFDGDLVVLAGDGPLIRADTIDTLLSTHRQTGAAATLATSVIDDPTGYGRIVRDECGRFQAIVEHKNASDDIRAIHEVYPSYACFDSLAMMDSLANLPADDISGEYYLTEVPARLHADGAIVEVVDAVPAEDVLSINTPDQLAEVDAILRARQQTPATEASP
ncbi:MAG: NTP transferase domain-containing protein [Phycisphaerales bacterium]|nr:NTP transferase domain-containing protein [Phycisphaerales bacterium]